MHRQKSALVVVSHYNAWPTDQLVALLDQLQTVPSGYPFSVRVVVNQAEDKPLILPDRHCDVAVEYRANTGWNIGGWDHGWRQDPPFDYYLFLQEECEILRPGWLKAFVRVAQRPQVGLVGEIIAYYNTTWEDVYEKSAQLGIDHGLTFFRQHMARMGVKVNETVDHIQSLVMCLRRDTLETIDGFRIGATKEEATACEIAISKCVQVVGLEIRQVHLRNFRYIRHPQWDAERFQAQKSGWWVRRFLSQYLYVARLQRFRRERARRRRGTPPLSVLEPDLDSHNILTGDILPG